MIRHTSGAMPPSRADAPASLPATGTETREVQHYVPWVIVICGLLVFTLRYGSPRPSFSVHANLFLTGLLIMFAGIAAAIAHGNPSRSYWSTINVAAGVWLVVSGKSIPSIPPVTLAQEGLGALVSAFALASLVSEIAFRRRVVKRANEDAKRTDGGPENGSESPCAPLRDA